MHKIVFILFLILSFFLANAQDQIILKDFKDTVYCKIISDKVLFIEYKLNGVADTNIHVIKSSEIEYYLQDKDSGYSEEEGSLYELMKNKIRQEKENRLLKEGVYGSIHNFLQNKPSIPGDVRINEVEKKYYVVDENGVKTNIGYSSWGFCDGITIFINDISATMNQQFYPILHMGVICLYDRVIKRPAGYYGTDDALYPFASSSLLLDMDVYSRKRMLVNIISNDRYKLNRYNVKNLVRKDSVLYEKFRNEEYQYLEELVFDYNKKYRNDTCFPILILADSIKYNQKYFKLIQEEYLEK